MSQDGQGEEGPPPLRPGVFITKGMRLQLQPFTVSVGPDGQVEIPPLELRIGLDLCPYWLEIALGHLRTTAEASARAISAYHEGDEEHAGANLEAEFEAWMQAIVAMEAFYAAVKEHVPVPVDLAKTWRKKQTARYRRITEVLRRAFPMQKGRVEAIRQVLRENLRFRDWAVHPPAGLSGAPPHPELGVATDWRYVAFRHYNAKHAVGLTLRIIGTLSARPHAGKHKSLREYCETLNRRVVPLVAAWEALYGESLRVPRAGGSPEGASDAPPAE